MVKKRRFSLFYAGAVKKHLRAIDAKYHKLIRSGVEAQLSFEPETETRNRKLLRRPIVAGAEWELRLGPNNRFRVFYEVDAEACEAYVLAVGVKEKNRLLIGGKEVEE